MEREFIWLGPLNMKVGLCGPRCKLSWSLESQLKLLIFSCYKMVTNYRHSNLFSFLTLFSFFLYQLYIKDCRQKCHKPEATEVETLWVNFSLSRTPSEPDGRETLGRRDGVVSITWQLPQPTTIYSESLGTQAVTVTIGTAAVEYKK